MKVEEGIMDVEEIIEVEEWIMEVEDWRVRIMEVEDWQVRTMVVEEVLIGVASQRDNGSGRCTNSELNWLKEIFLSQFILDALHRPLPWTRLRNFPLS